MKKNVLKDPIVETRTLLVGIDAPYNVSQNTESYFQEFRNLVRSNGIVPTVEVFMKLRSIDPGHFLTKGKLEELQKLCEENDIEEVVFSEPLTVQQERNLTEVLHARVFDRTQLILEIFERGAQSSEGKIQVALALLQHAKSRLAGHGLGMSQQSGWVGTKGPGETQKEKDTRHLEHLMTKLRKDLVNLRKVRDTQRKQRLEARVPHMCIIGYTNAGKSTILNALTKSDVLAEDKLFATLDTTTRELFIDGKKKGVISDTVGFIQKLPHNLIEAFKSTLDELQYAHLLLQVIDASDPNWESHIRVVHEVLVELGVEDKPMLYVFNKIDKVEDRELFETKISRYQPHVMVSALSYKGLEPLLNYLKSWKI
jgi:GTP-binding protein HflX